MSNASVFSTAFSSIEEEIPYKNEWENGTGYLDHVVEGKHAPMMPAGAIAKSMAPDGRRIIIVGTRFGNVAVFDRYIKQDATRGVFVTNSPEKSIFKMLLSGSSVGELEMVKIVGSWGDLDDNVGMKLEKIAEDFK
jgi:hypothetical protein